MWVKLENPPLGDPFSEYILNLEASLHSLLSFAWTLTRPTNYLRQNTVFSYSDTRRWYQFLVLNHFFSFSLFFFVILLLLFFTKTMLLLSFYLINFFFMKITFIFSCSRMFRVPGFIDPVYGFVMCNLWKRVIFTRGV